MIWPFIQQTVVLRTSSIFGRGFIGSCFDLWQINWYLLWHFSSWNWESRSNDRAKQCWLSWALFGCPGRQLIDVWNLNIFGVAHTQHPSWSSSVPEIQKLFQVSADTGLKYGENAYQAVLGCSSMHIGDTLPLSSVSKGWISFCSSMLLKLAR